MASPAFGPRFVAFAAILLFCITTRAHHAEGFLESEIARPDGGAWQEAVGIAFQESGRTWVWERGGQIWIIDDTEPVPEPFLDISEEVGAWHDHGLLGFALDPRFEQTGYVYLLYLVDRHHLLNCSEPATGSGEAICGPGYDPFADAYFQATIGRLTRYRASLPEGASNYASAVSVDPTSRTVLIGSSITNGIPSTSRSHVTGSLVFGVDGTLLITTGDGARSARDSGSSSTEGDDRSYTLQALADGIIDPAQDVGANRAQMPDSLSGKVLRIDPATGEGVPSNPFFDSAAPASPRSRTFALGLRNPYRATLAPGTGSHDPADGDPGRLVIGDVGFQTWEEINVLEERGQNFGWPIYEGMRILDAGNFGRGQLPNVYAPNPLFGTADCDREYFEFSDLLVQETLNTAVHPNPCDGSVSIAADTPAHMHTRPVLAWMHQGAVTETKGFGASGDALVHNIDDPDSPIQGLPFSGSTVTSGVFYSGSDLPPEYSGNYFFGDYVGQWIRRLIFDASGEPQAVEVFSDGGEPGGVVHIASNPATGGIYYIPWTIAVRRLDYAPDGTLPPNIVLSTSDVYGPGPLTVDFDASSSSDPEGMPLTFAWDFGDGNSATGPSVQHTFDAPGIETYPVRLTVTDADGGTSTETIVVSPNNTPPQVAIISPVDATEYSLSGDVTYDLLADIRDAEHASGALACEWQVRLHHNTHSHGGPPIAGCAAEAVVSPAGCDGESYYWKIDLTVTDPAGLTGSDSVILETPDCESSVLAPVANGDLADVEAAGSVSIPVLQNDFDDAGLDPNSVTLTGAPPVHGDAGVDPGTGAVWYQHSGTAGSIDVLTYTVDDTDGLTSNAASVVVRSIAPDEVNPTEPGGFTVLGTTSSEVSLDWLPSTDNVGVAGYRLYRDGAEIADLTGTSYADQSLPPDTTFDYAVEAYDAARNVSTQASLQAATSSVILPLTVSTVADTYTRTKSETENFGNDTILRVQPWAEMRGFVRFDLSSLPAGTPIASATLRLAVDDVKVDGTVEVRRVLGGWAEQTITRANEPGLSAALTSFAVSSADNGRLIEIDVTGLVAAWLADPATNFGLALTETGANVWFDSREGGIAAEIDVVPSGPVPNQAPQVDAGADRTVSLATGASLSGTVTDDGLPDPPGAVSLAWTLDSGPASVTFSNPTAPDTDVGFSQPGTYVLQLSANDGELGSSDTLTLEVVEGTALPLTVSTVADTYTRTKSETENFGNDTILRVQPWAEMRGFVRFDLSSLPAGTPIASATLRLAVDDVKVDGTVEVRRVLGGWAEQTITRANEPGLSAALTSFAVSSADNGRLIEIDVTGLVAAWLADPATNFGLALTETGANVWFDSREGGIAAEIDVVPSGPVPNQAPQVDAGADRTVSLATGASLSGTVTDDGLPDPPGAVSLAWTLDSGPASVTFSNPTAPDTDVGFSQPGTYVLQLSANDGELGSSDTVSVDVFDPDANQPPTANAGGDVSAEIGTAVALSGSFTDDGRPDPPGQVSTLWTQVSGPAMADFADADDPETGVTFDTAGDFVLRLTVDDGELQDSDDVAISVFDPAAIRTVPAIADTYSRTNAASENFGSDVIIRVQPWGDMTGFLRFDLGELAAAGSVSSAILHLPVDDVKVDGDVEVRRVLGDWNEQTLTRNNQPPLGSPAVAFQVAFGDTGSQIDVDITGVVNSLLGDPANDFGIALTQDGANVWFDSRESGTPISITATPGPAPLPAFTDVSMSSGTGGPDFFGGHGVQFADADRDGFPDVYVTMNETDVGDMADLFYRNIDGATFAEEAAARGIDNFDTGSHGGVFADFDNDGDFDFYNGSYDQNRVYRNNGTGRFEDMTALAGLPVRLWPTRGVAAFDMDLDGDLDIAAINGAFGSADPSSERNEFYRNDGGFSFTALDLEPLFSAPAGQGITDVDYDNDGDIDLFAANRNGDVIILRNLAGAGFEVVAPANIGFVHMAGDGITFGDANNDGWLDVLLDNEFYLSDGDGTFTHRQTLAGPEIPYMGGFADLDNDGDKDVVVPGANFVYWNDGAGNFGAGDAFLLGTTGDPRSVAFADIENDGDLDFFYAQKQAFNLLVRNNYGGSNRWLGLLLYRSSGQVGAFGARIYVYEAGGLNDPARLITWKEVRSQDGYLSQSDPRVVLGLADNDLVDLRVVFPAGGEVTLDGVPAGQTVEIQE